MISIEEGFVPWTGLLFGATAIAALFVELVYNQNY